MITRSKRCPNPTGYARGATDRSAKNIAEVCLVYPASTERTSNLASQSSQRRRDQCDPMRDNNPAMSPLTASHANSSAPLPWIAAVEANIPGRSLAS